MATDIQNLLKQAQSVINTGVKTVKETRITADVLQKNIEITDRKIGIHNVNEEAHPDIRAELESLFSLPNDTVIDGPSVAEQNYKTTWTLSISGMDKNTFIIKYYRVYLSNGDVFIVDANADGTGTYEGLIKGEDGDVVTISAAAVMTNNYRTLVGTKDITLTKHTPPDLSAMTHTFPEVVSYGKTYTWKVEGITDIDGDLAKINVTLDNDKATLSQSEGIEQGTEYTLTIADDLEGPGVLTATITAIDDYGYTNSTSVNMRINQRPYGMNISRLDECTVLRHLPANATRTWYPSCRLKCEYITSESGETTYQYDPDNDKIINIEVTVDNAAITMKDTELSLPGDGYDFIYFKIEVGDLQPGDPYTFTFTVTDEYGAQAITKYTSAINYPPDVSNATVTGIPTIVKSTGERFNVKINGVTDPDGDGIYASMGNFTIIVGTSEKSYGDGIQFFETDEGAYELTGIYLSKWELPSGTTDAPFKIYIKDNAGGSTLLVDTTIRVNSLPDVSGVDVSDQVVASDSTVELPMYGATDVDTEQTLTYTWTCDNENVKIINTVSNEDNTGESKNIALVKIPDADIVAGGTKLTMTLTVSDGLESVTKTCVLTVNQLPVIPDDACTIPAKITPGIAKTFTVSGITDPDDDTVSVYISFDSVGVTIDGCGDASTESVGDKTFGGYALTQGKEYTITLNKSLDTDGTTSIPYTIYATDGYEVVESTHEIIINRCEAELISVTHVYGGDSVYNAGDDATYWLQHLGTAIDEIKFVWSDDPDGIYTTNVTMVNTTDANRQFRVDSQRPIEIETERYFYLETNMSSDPESNTPQVGDQYVITITATDKLGATSTKTIEGTVSAPPVVDDLDCTIPELVAPGSTITVTVNGGCTDELTAAEDLRYRLHISTNDIFTLNEPSTESKSYTDFFKAGESKTITVSEDAVRGSSTHWIDVIVYDELGNYTRKFFYLKVNTLPNIDNVKCNFQLENPNSSLTLGNNGATDADTSNSLLLTYTWSVSDDRITIVNVPATITEYMTTNSKVQVTIPDETVIPRGTTYTATCEVSDGIESVSKTFDCKINELPDFTNATITAPSMVTAGKSYPFRISGIVDPEGYDLTSIQLVTTGASSLTNCTLYNGSSNTSGRNLAQDTEYTLTINSDIDTTTVFSIDIKARDSKYATATKTIEIPVNQSPDYSDVVASIPARLNANSTATASVTGAVDPEGQAVTYSISCDNSAITFSKASGIAMDEDITITTGTIAEGTEYTITLTFTDEDGAVATKTITGAINQSPDVSDFLTTAATIVAPGSSNTVSFSGAIDPEGQAITYSIENVSSGLTFSKTSGIAANEEVTMSVASSATRGAIYSYDVVAVDADGGRTKQTVSVTINQLPVVTSATIDLPEWVVPGKTYTVTASGATDPDGQTLTYELSSTSLTITKNDDGTFTVVVPEDATRGSGDIIDIIVSDGLESSTTTGSFLINRLPTIDNIAEDDDAIVKYGDISAEGTFMYGGSANTRTISVGIRDDDDLIYGPELFTETSSGLTADATKFSGRPGSTFFYNVEITATPVEEETTETLTIIAQDSCTDEQVTKTFTIIVKPMTRTSTPSITSPTEGATVAHESGFEATFSAYESYIDTVGTDVYPTEEEGGGE